MEFLIEEQRNLHETSERAEQAIVKILLSKSKTHRDKLINERRIRKYLDMITMNSKKLLTIYEDQNQIRKKEIDDMDLSNGDFSSFYDHLKEIKEYHKNHPNESVSLEEEFGRYNKQEELDALEKLFTGEEFFGRYLDLNELYNVFINLKFADKTDYLTYLKKLNQFESIPQDKKDLDYVKYLNRLLFYLEDFLKKTQPLLNMEQIQKESEQELEKDFASDSVPGWQLNYKQLENLPALLYCFACQKIFSKETVYEGHLTGKKHKKETEKLKNKKPNKKEIEASRLKIIQEVKEREHAIISLEYLIKKYLHILTAEWHDTISSVERKQVLNLDEWKHKAEEQNQDFLVAEDPETQQAQEEEEEDEKIYNPLKLPIGWDGKPIPYWLWKLHGLGIEYPCEICGNFVYMGRKAFEKHFQEWRHAHGMRCLGIPNTTHFQEITRIEDAMKLWEKLKKDEESRHFKPEIMEEFEDEHGNVFNKKTFDDLKRQGLL